MLNNNELTNLFAAFSNLNIMVVGDVMIDAYLWGKVDRISPEAPVPIVEVNRRCNMLGGAANVALNIKALGANPILCSVIGNDSKGDEFINLLSNDNLTTAGLHKSNERVTTTKFRIIGNKTQLLRVDEEIKHDLMLDEEEHLIENILRLTTQYHVDAIIMQDYNKGVLTLNVIQQVIEHANKLNIPVIVDPKKKNFTAYRNVTLFKPNLKELREGMNLEFAPESLDDLTQVVKQLQEEQNIGMVMTTLSEKGVFIQSNSTQHHIPAHLRNITDVSGAGDTVVSVATLCLALHTDIEILARLSNLAGGLVCEEVGVVSVNKQRLFEEALKL